MTKKIILDCDPGHDDAVAIMLAAASNNIEILGITCVGGNSTLENTQLNALKICTLINRTDIKIYAGSNKPINYDLVTAAHVHGKSGLDTDGDPIIVDSSYKIQEENAVDFIINECHKYIDPIYLCPTGPLTNIALSLQKDPSIKEKIKEIVFMGGAALCIGNITPSAEFNIYVDPHAANIVLKSGIPITMMGLDVTHKVNVNDEIIKNIKKNNNKSSKFFAELMNFYSRFHRQLYEIDESPLHDPCVIAYLIDETIFKGKLVNVQVEENSELTRGKTVVDWLGVTNRQPNCKVITEANANKFFDLLSNELSKLT
ncbi:MAG: Pyrimidine-specific ribonucleoside hydrolase RihA [Alphaproteobacteria bacterium MarineAlpha5_Bin6]|nr:MAG: Pyrimidine-specific ribonucleoside hydrolase RihA [Alphaproteobacteria bacterium MarineAlpha5_Bin7]PPR53785.1 MAG: Pyrimidine-specific ribonucleoside hydrolase RihA [Alphaproteobacteria bacterium MarineAlpha5_Bin6]|tara:strand:+ start:1546 stop:2490 length:945 start_codon:yes stop_codon:yes gene_type:complete